MEDWLSPLNRVKFQRAFRNKAAQVVLRDGRKFVLKYTKKRFYGERVEVVFISPEYEFVPCGYFRMEKVLEKDWLFEQEQQQQTPGIYDKIVNKFIDSEFNGVNVLEEYKELQGKNYQTIRRGLALAVGVKGKEADHVSVVTDDEVVFLLKGSVDD